MNQLTLKPDPNANQIGDKMIAVPTLAAGATVADTLRQARSARALRRRFNTTRLQIDDTGLRPFRIY
jgi:hypothetical protein